MWGWTRRLSSRSPGVANCGGVAGCAWTQKLPRQPFCHLDAACPRRTGRELLCARQSWRLSGRACAEVSRATKGPGSPQLSSMRATRRGPPLGPVQTSEVSRGGGPSK